MTDQNGETEVQLIQQSHSFVQLIQQSHSFVQLIQQSHSFVQLIQQSHSFVQLIQQSHWFHPSHVTALRQRSSPSCLHGIKPSVGKPPQIYTGNRRDQVVLSRCRIGHLWLTHGFLLKGEHAP